MNATELKEKKNNPSSSHTDIVGVYLGEIARFPMLDPSEEIILGKQVQRMMSCRETKQKPRARNKHNSRPSRLG